MTLAWLLLHHCLALAPALAEDCANCGVTTFAPNGEFYKKQLQTITLLPELSADTDSYKKSACHRKAVPTEKAFRDRFAKLAADGTATTDAVVHGVRLNNESVRLVELFKALTTHTGYCPTMGAGKSCQTQISVPTDCDKVSCALATLFGEKAALRMVYLYDEHSLNASPIAFSPGYKGEIFKNWEPDELDDIVMAVSDMPPAMTAGLVNKQLTRRKLLMSEITKGAVLADSRMSFNDLWSLQNRELRRTTAYHEFAHNFAHLFDLADSELWKGFSGWKETMTDGEKTFTSAKPETLLSRYAAASPDEDFAETVTAYRYNPKELLEASREKYDFIKDVVFDGVEFLKKRPCKAMPPLSADWKDKTRAKIEAWKQKR